MIQETSTKAYTEEVAPALGRKQAAIRRLLLVNPQGMTNAEIARALEWSINRVTPRTNELVKLGAIVDAGTRSCRVTGRTAHVWKLKPLDIPKVERSEVKPINQLQLI